MLPVWTKGRLPVPRAEVDPLEFVRAIEWEECWDKVLDREGASIRSYMSLEQVRKEIQAGILQRRRDAWPWRFRSWTCFGGHCCDFFVAGAVDVVCVLVTDGGSYSMEEGMLFWPGSLLPGPGGFVVPQIVDGRCCCRCRSSSST